MAFPVSPIDGATATVNGITYSYSAADNAWTRQLSPIANLTVTGNIISGGNLIVSGDTFTNKLYTTNGLYWSGNGEVIATGGGGTPVTPFVSDTDLGLTTDSVTESFNFGLVTDLTIDTTYDLGTISTGISGDSILHYSITGDKLVTGTDLNVGNITAAGDLTFTGTRERITGDFSNATIADQLMFQTSTVNGSTSIYAIPNGTSTVSQFVAANNSDPTNAGIMQAIALSTDIQIRAGITGTGTYLPMTFYTGGLERVKVAEVTGNVVITSTTISTGTTTGALVVRGGVGIDGNVNISSNVSISRSLGVGTAVAGNIGEIRATNYITAFYSDKRLKSNIEPITGALSKVKQLAGVLYTQNTLAEQYGYCDYGQQVGLFAQDVQQVLPQVVKPAPFDVGPGGTSISEQNYLTIQYEKMVPLLVEAIKELSDLVDQLKAQ